MTIAGWDLDYAEAMPDSRATRAAAVSHHHQEEIPMSFVCSATWTANQGMADVVREAVTQLSPASPGVRV